MTVTVPYRAFALLITLLVIFLNIKKRVRKSSFAMKILWLYWIALIIRIFYDTNIRNDVHITDTSRLWLYIFGIILPVMFSMLKSYHKIDMKKALKWIYIGTAITLILSLFNNSSLLLEASEISGRTDGNVGLNSIHFGHLGTMGILLSIFILSKIKLNMIKKISIIAVTLLSFFIMLRAGSRSPILALVVVILFWLFSQGKNVILGFYIALITIILLFIFIDPILSFIGNISPVIEYRLRASIFMGDTSGREPLYEEAINAFIEKPLFGSQFALFNRYGGFSYSHNFILDSFMGLGIFGGLAIIYVLWTAIKKSYILIKKNNPSFWFVLILIQQIVLGMLSSSIYYNQILNVLLVFVILYSNVSVKNNKSEKYLQDNV
ncbi:MAG: O-antigen ligase family protein [Tissierellia bacterium]|nr:O-antigen ligase family protein [Tissierellia bacterium]